MEDQIINSIFNLYRKMDCKANQMVMIQSLWICDQMADRNQVNQVIEGLLTNRYLYINEQKPYCVFLSQLGYDTYIN